MTDDINDNQFRSKKSLSDAKIRCGLPNINDSLETVPFLTTLVLYSLISVPRHFENKFFHILKPKARPLHVNPSKNTTVDADPLATGRNRLGIDISAVHDAVIRGIARIPGETSYLDSPSRIR